MKKGYKHTEEAKKKMRGSRKELPTKECEQCHKIFRKGIIYSYKQWDKQRFCSVECKCKWQKLNPFYKDYMRDTFAKRLGKKRNKFPIGKNHPFWIGGIVYSNGLIDCIVNIYCMISISIYNRRAATY